MKTVKHILILVFVAFMSTTLMAQESTLTEEQKNQMQEQLKVYYDNLDLTEAQKPKFEEITIKYGKQLMHLKESNKGKLAKRKEFKTINENRNAEMKLLLSEEQFLEYQEIQKEMQEKMKEKMKEK